MEFSDSELKFSDSELDLATANYIQRKLKQMDDHTRRGACSPRGVVLRHMDYPYIGLCSPKGKGFSAILVTNRVSILAILVVDVVQLFQS